MSEQSPKKDFYQWVNEKWFADPQNKIPADYSSWGGFTKLYDEGLINQINLVKEISDNKNKLAYIWNASMNKFKQWDNEEGNYNPVRIELAHLDNSLPPSSFSINNLSYYISYCQINGLSSPFSIDKGSDLENSDNIKLDISPSGLSLPSRAYYFDKNFTNQLCQFTNHLENVEKICKENNIELENNFVEKVVGFEKMLAEITMEREQSRDYDKYYTNTTLINFYEKINDLKAHPNKQNNNDKIDLNKEEIKQFMENIYKTMNLRQIMEKNYNKNYKVNDTDVYFMTAYDGDYFRKLFPILLNHDNFNFIRAYYQYKIIRYVSCYCKKELDEEFFDFYSKKLGGQQQQKSYEKRSINTINMWTGELLGKLYVDKYFSNESKKDIEQMIPKILDIMEVSIKNNDWLTEETKEKALLKLSKFGIKIGFPDEWKDYSSLNIEESDTLYNMRKKVIEFNYQKEFLEKINTPVDKKEWHMTPQTVNAYFSPSLNEIVFPAAILQPPFYHATENTIDFPIDNNIRAYCKTNNLKMTIPVNLGGIGAVIAHEITHGYDDNGRKFDGDGNLNNWWSDGDIELFVKKAEQMGWQTDKYEFIDGDNTHKMNAHLTMGENLADLGGLTLAVKSIIANSPIEHHKTLLHLLFKSWANVWKFKTTKEAAINRLATDPHAPSSFRGNMVANIDEFYTTFEIEENDYMYIRPNKRVKMW